MSHVRSRGFTVLAVAVAAVLVLAIVWLFLSLTAGETESALPSEPEVVSAGGVETFHFEDLGTMTASSDLVVKGTVVRAAPGCTHKISEEPGGAWTDRDLTVRVDDIVYNRHEVHVPSRITVTEGQWSDGVGIAWEGMPWSHEGDSGFFYLVQGPHDSYTYRSSFGRVMVESEAEGIRPSGSHHEGPWVSHRDPIQGAAQLDDIVQEAAAAAQSGRAQPIEEPPVYGPPPPVSACQPQD